MDRRLSMEAETVLAPVPPLEASSCQQTTSGTTLLFLQKVRKFRIQVGL